jgi:hypothetical protein
MAAVGQFGFAESAESPIAWVSILLEASMGPMSTRGRIIGQGHLVAAKARLKKAGKTIAAIQRIVFHFTRFFLSELLVMVR